jgi:hypothetical protein
VLPALVTVNAAVVELPVVGDTRELSGVTAGM